MYLKLGCRVLVAALAGALAVVAPATAAHAAVTCEVNYSVNNWQPGFTGNAVIKNTGTDTWNGYTVQFRFTGAQTVVSLWPLPTWSQSGQAVTAASSQWAPPVPPGGVVYLGFTASNPYPLLNPPPVDWRINGVPCATPGAPTVVAEPDVVTIPEGSSGSYSVRLSHPPTQSVSLGMRSTGTGTWAAPPVILVFTPTNWSTPQVYTVYSMEDPDTIDDRVVVTLTATGYAPDTVVLQQVDNDG